MTPIVYAFSEALLHFVWQGLVVAVLLWMALFCLRKRSAEERYAASCGALALMAALPAVTTWLLYAPASPVPHEAAGSGAISAAIHRASTVLGGASSSWALKAHTWALPVWAFGVMVFSLRMVWGCAQVSRLRRSGAPATEPIAAMIHGLAGRIGLLRPVRVIISAASDGPSVVGWIRPLVLLPASAIAGLTPDQLEAVLAHELAHIRRHDYLCNLLQMVVETLLFYHPAVWWVSARIRRERELCCDDLAVRACNDAFCYARALTTLEKLRAPAMVLGSTDGPLMYRIRRIVGVPAQESGPPRASGLLALAMAAACIGMSVQWARAQSEIHAGKTIGFAYLRILESGVSVDTSGAPLLHRPEIEYPDALREKVQGIVTLEVTLDAAGKVSDAHVVSGPAELRLSALRAVLGFHFASPAANSTRQIRMIFQPPAPGGTSNVSNENLARDLAVEISNVKIDRDLTTEPGILVVQDAAIDTRSMLGLQSVRGDMELRVGERPATLSGRTVERLVIEGLTDAGSAELRSRLPLREGEVLSPAMIEGVEAELKKFDEHLEMNWTIPNDKGGVVLRISPRQ